MTENFLKKKDGLKNSTLGKVSFVFMMIALVSLILNVLHGALSPIDGIGPDYPPLVLLLSVGLMVGGIGGFILGIVALFQKGYKKILAIISVVIGSIFAILILIGSLAG